MQELFGKATLKNVEEGFYQIASFGETCSSTQ